MSYDCTTNGLTGVLNVEGDERLQIDDRNASQEQISRVSYVLHDVRRVGGSFSKCEYWSYRQDYSRGEESSNFVRNDINDQHDVEIISRRAQTKDYASKDDRRSGSGTVQARINGQKTTTLLIPRAGRVDSRHRIPHSLTHTQRYAPGGR